MIKQFFQLTHRQKFRKNMKITKTIFFVTSTTLERFQFYAIWHLILEKRYWDFWDFWFRFRDYVLWDFCIHVRNILRFLALSCTVLLSRRPRVNNRIFVEFHRFQRSWNKQKNGSHWNSWAPFLLKSAD